MPTEALRDALTRYWGYTTFRPLQHEAMEAVLSGRDSIVVLPTGGGKSLCFQAPAAAADSGLAVVVSPLISLMKDQVDTLVGNGVPAALFNSSLGADEKAAVMRGLAEQRYGCSTCRRSGSSATAATGSSRGWPAAACASSPSTKPTASASGGTIFVPSTGSWRGSASGFPGVSMHAYTATATARVRRDIASQLALRDPIELGRVVRPPEPRLPRAAAGSLKQQSST